MLLISNFMNCRTAQAAGPVVGAYTSVLCRRDEADSQQHNSSQQHLKQLPNGAAAACASRADIMARCKPQLAWAVAVVFLLLPFLEHYIDPPQVIWKLLLVASKNDLQHSLWDDQVC